ncbi:MAG: redox-regulated ATPase YchF [bacterium]|nr:redox-regulated ATPase YchF [bacterium]
MKLSVGIVGLPNVGKSTLFNALLKKRIALSANYPFATIEPNVGVVAVPDGRLAALAELVKKEEGMESLPPLVPAVVEFVDIAGLVKGANEGAGLGNKFLSHIREVDAIIHVLRDFADEDVIREGAENPEADKMTVETELSLADLATLDKLISGQEKEARTSKDKLDYSKLEVLQKLKDKLDTDDVLNDDKIDEKLRDWFRRLPLLSIKPVLYVLNVSEKDYSERVRQSVILVSEAHPESDKERSWTSQDDRIIIISAKLEEELADYTEEERVEYLKSVGIEKTGLERLIIKAYDLLGLIPFLTAGPKEVRAWTIKRGTKAPQAAGVIHTDFEKGFIRAQVVTYEDLIRAGSFAEAKKLGLMRTEGKGYEIKDGDVVEFLVNN